MLCAGGILIPAVKFIPLFGWYGGGIEGGFAVAQWKGNGGRQLYAFGDDRVNPFEIYINVRNPTPTQG